MARRYCLTLDLKDDPQLIAEYRRQHTAVWREVTDCMRAAGIVDMELHLLGTRLFMIMDVDDNFSFENKTRIERDYPKVQEWEQLMWKFQQPMPTAKLGEKWILMERIFKLELEA
jgi:L-rhamnose mutarotase